MNQIFEDSEIIVKNLDFAWFRGKSILITGASGMVGSYLVATFVSAAKLGVGPRELFVISNSGVFPINLADVDELKITQIKMDLCDQENLRKLPNVDVIFHAAGYAQPQVFMKKPFSTIALNSYVTHQLSMRVKDGGKFLFLSSSEVYSGSTNLPFVESDIGITNTTHPRAPYIEGKKIGECIVNAVREERRIDAVSVRLSQAYGPGSKLGDKRFMNNFIASALTKNEIKLMDSGDSYRNYCYISDAVEMILAIMLCGDAPIYNVGGISKASILDIAKMISSITNSTVEKGPKEVNPDGAPQMVEVDLSLFNSIHKKTNYVSLREGIYRTVEWQKQYIFNKLS